MFNSPPTGDLTLIGTGVWQQREAVAAGHHRIGDHESLVEEELQHRNTSTCGRAVARGIGGVVRRTFGEGLGKQVALILAEAARQGFRIQDIAIQCGLDIVSVARLNQFDDSAGGLGTKPEVDQLLLVPDRIQGAGGNFSERRLHVGGSPSAEAVLRPVTKVGAARVRRRGYSAQHQEGVEELLKQPVNVGKCGAIPPVTQVTQFGVILVG